MDEDVLTTVAGVLTRGGLYRRDARLLIAVSGGADSVALLYAMYALRERAGFTLRAAHVEHGLRGEASLGDAAFVRALCAALDVPFTCDRAALADDGRGMEARAREARYALLLNRARECRADALLLAHHRDDQAETLLLHLLRGSGARGLGGMRERSTLDGVTLLRPLLALSRDDLRAFLGDADYRTDATNAEPCCLRNRLRHTVLPLLTAEQPRAVEHMAQSAALLALDEDCLQAQASALLANVEIDRPPLACLLAAPLRQAPPAVAVRAIRAFAERMLLRAGAPADDCALSAADSLALLSLLTDGGSRNLPRDLRADIGATALHIVRMADGAPVAPADLPAPMPLTDGARFADLTFRFDPDAPPDGKRAVALPPALLARCVLRLPQPGDRIRPFGAPGRKELRRFLTDRKLDAPFRAVLPVLCDGDDVLWAIGLGASERTRLTADAIRVRVEGDIPWLTERAGALAANDNHPPMKE